MTNYNILKVRVSDQSVCLSKGWLKENLDAKKNDLILQKTEIIDGKKTVTLVKFDPSSQMPTNSEPVKDEEGQAKEEQADERQTEGNPGESQTQMEEDRNEMQKDENEQNF